MTHADLMEALAAAGIRPQLTDDGKFVVTNAKALTEPLREALRTHKDKIVRDLKRPLLDVVMECFPGTVVDKKGMPVKYKPAPEVGVQMAIDEHIPVSILPAYLFLDIETTGLNPQSDQVTEIAWRLDYHGNVKKQDQEFCALIQHDVTPCKWRLEKTDYVERRKDGVSSEIALSDALATLKEHCGQACSTVYLVGANPTFDHGFIARHFSPTPYHYHLIDIENLAMQAFGLPFPPAMWEISKLLGIPRSNDAPHTAMADVMETRDLFYRLRALGRSEK